MFCSGCQSDRPDRKGKSEQAYCAKCHAAYQRHWRKWQKDLSLEQMAAKLTAAGWLVSRDAPPRETNP